MTSSVVARDFASPVAFQWAIRWDRNNASFDAITNVQTDLANSNDFIISLADTAQGEIRILYSSFSTALTFANPTSMFDLNLKLELAGTADVSFGPSNLSTFPIEFNGDPNLPALTNTWDLTVTGGGGTGGSNPCTGITAPSVVFEDATIQSGTNGCVAVRAANLDPLSELTFTLDYDNTVLTNPIASNVFAAISSDFNFDAITGVASFVSSGGADVAIPACQTLFEVCFDAIGPGTSTTVDLDSSLPVTAESASGPYAGITSVSADVTVSAPAGGGSTDPCAGTTGPTIVIGDTTVVSGSRGCTPVYASQLDPLTTFTFTLDFDAALLTNTALENIYAPIANDVLYNPSNGRALFFQPMGIDIAVPECTVLFDLCYDAVGGAATTTISVDQTQTFEIGQVSGPYTATVQDGDVVITAGGGTGNSSPCDGISDPTLVFGDTTVVTGMRGCVPVYAANLDPLTSFTFTIDIDQTIFTSLALENVYAPIAADLQFNSGNGNVLFFETGGLDIPVPNCTVLFDVCFDASGPAATYPIDVDPGQTFELASNAGGVYTNATTQAGSIEVVDAPPATPCDNLTDPTLVFGDTSVVSGMRECVPVYAANLDPLTSFTFTVDIDQAIFTGLALENIYAPIATDLQFDSANGNVMFAESGGLDVAVPNCTVLFDVCFDASGPAATYPIDVDAGETFEAASSAGPYMNLTSQGGTITVEAAPPTTPCDGLTEPTVVFGDTTVNSGTMGCVPVYFSNLDPLTSFNFFLEFDPAAVTALNLQNIYAPIAPDLQFNAMTGSVLYFNTMGLDVPVPECQLAFEVCFTGAGPSSTSTINIDDTQANEFASNATGVYGNVVFEAGTINIVGAPVIPEPCDDFTGPTLYTHVDSGAVNDVVCVPVIGFSLGDVTAFTLDLDSDGSVVTFQDTGFARMSIRDGLSVDAGNATISFAAPGGTPVALDACDTLLTVCYTLTGSPQDSTGVTFGTNTSVTNAGGAITPAFVNGGLKITGMVMPNCDPIVITNTVTQPTCNGDTDGAVDITATGGDGNFTYAWDDGSTSEDRTNLAAGTYTVTVTSCNGMETNSSTIIVGQPDAVSGTATTVNPSCNGATTGSIDLTPMGGTAPYTYAWTGPGVDPGMQDQSNLGAGTFTVIITDANMCTGNASFTLTEPDALVIGSDVTQPTGGASNGAIDITVTGGTGPGTYSYAWTGPGVQATSEDQTNLDAGTFTVTVTDGNSCTAMATFTLTQDAPSLSISSTPSCSNSSTGTIDLTVTGGTPGFNYSWTGGLPDQEDHTNVAAGTYTVTVTDAANNTAMATVTVGTHPVVNLPANITPSTGNNDGAIDVMPSGGSGGTLTFLWDTGQTTEDISGLAQGQYRLTVTDQGTGCTYVGVYDVPFDPQSPQVITSTTAVSCNSANGGTCDGSFRLQITSAVFPATVTFTNGPSVGLPASQTFTGVTDETFTGLCPGTFDVELVDAAGQPFSETGLTIGEPSAIEITDAVIRPVTGAGAANGGVNITVVGGTPTYNFLWSSGSTNEDLAGVPVGSYRVTITDANGCILTSSDYAVQRLRVSSAQIDSVFCINDANGAIDIEVTGADGPFSYLWSNGATTQDISGVPGGSYTVTITHDASGASITESYVIGARSSINVTALTDFNFNGQQISCPGASDGSAFTNVTGAVGNVTYVWSNGATGPQVNGLAAGAYTVTATDELGCSSTFAIALEDPTGIEATLSVDDIRCPDGPDNGRVTVIPSGGTLVDGYDYVWSNGVIGVPTIGTLSAGSYTVTVIDDNGCSADFTAGVAQPDPLTADVEVVDANDNVPGSIELFPMGGTSPYTYNWAGREDTTRILDGLPFGTYTVTITDANNCEPLVLSIQVKNETFECFRASDVLTPGATPGLNDLFEINCIEDFPDNSVEVYNRWGQQVYAESGYDNTSVVFDGFSDGQVLDEGGYFYVLRYRDANGDQQLLKGSLNILR